MPKQSATRYRNFATIIYPESAPESWVDILTEWHISALISPLHDKDINPGGEPKKAHYHVLLMYDSVKTKAQAQEVIQSIGGVGLEPVSSVRGYARYLCHLDNPEKAQYQVEDVRCLSGADWNTLVSLPSDKFKAIREMIEFCSINGIFAYCDLLEYAMNEREDWFVCLCENGTYVIKEYLKSVSWKKNQGFSEK